MRDPPGHGHDSADADPLARLYRAHRDSLHAHAAARLGDSVAAEDTVQEAFRGIIRALASGSLDVERVGYAYLLRSVTRECRRHNGRATKLIPYDPAVLERMPQSAERADYLAATHVTRVDDRIWLRNALAALPPKCRRVVTLQLHGYRYAEIADIEGMSANTVDAHLQSAKRLLRRAAVNPQRKEGRKEGRKEEDRNGRKRPGPECPSSDR